MWPPITMTRMQTDPLSTEQEKGKEKPIVGFPFDRLSTELALEIIRCATTPDFKPISVTTIQPRDPSVMPRKKTVNPYSTALSMCLVSHAARSAAIPHLLYTVALSETHNVHAFIRAVHIQRGHHRPSPSSPHSQNRSKSRLAVDYTRYVKRMWCGICWENDPGSIFRDMDNNHDLEEEEWLDYRALWEVMRGVESLGIHFRGLHLLYNGLATDVNITDAVELDSDKSKDVVPESTSTHQSRRPEWNCRRVTLVGDRWRWIPLTSTAEGAAFLARIKHLVIWIPETVHGPGSPPQPPPPPYSPPYQSQTNTSSSSSDSIIPPWLVNAPFNMMRSLTDLGFLPKPTSGNPNTVPTEMVVYHLPLPTSDDDSTLAGPDGADRDDRDPEQFRRWAVEDITSASASMDANTNRDTVRKRHGLVVPLNLDCIQFPAMINTAPSVILVSWESAWLMGQSEYSWKGLL